MHAVNVSYGEGVDNAIDPKTRRTYTLRMATGKPKREIATKQIRVYESTLKVLQKLSFDTGKTIARILSEKVKV